MATYQSQFTGAQIDQRLAAVSNKQDTLVSGTNIKTVNNQSVLGSGNLEIQGGSADAVLYTEQALTSAQKTQARNNIGAGTEQVQSDWEQASNASADFIKNKPAILSSVTSSQDGTIVLTFSDGNTITVDLNHDHPAYYAKAVGTSQPSGGFLPDVVYKLGTITGTVTFALASAVSGNVNHYFWTFDTSSTAPTITFPSGITWADSAPTIAASKHYEISILNNIATYMEV